jgi:hypothetical protein
MCDSEEKINISAISYTGDPAKEFYSAIIAKPFNERSGKWIESIAESLKRLEGCNIEELYYNETFITIVMHASQSAIRNHQEEKLDALRNAVLNSALPNPPEEDLQLIFINLIDSFVPWHLKALYFLNNPKKYNISSMGIAKAKLSIKRDFNILMAPFPELINRGSFCRLLIRNLLSLNLIYSDADDLDYGTKNKNEFIVTGMGCKFLKFITSPLEANK